MIDSPVVVIVVVGVGVVVVDVVVFVSNIKNNVNSCCM